MTANINAETGIPYGIIKANAIHSDVLDTLTIHNGKDLTYESALADYLAEKRREHENHADEHAEDFDEDAAKDEFGDWFQADETIYAGEHEGVTYQTTWLGGAQMLYVFKSPVVTLCRPCSPCVPNAGDLDSVGSYEAYGVPSSWLTTDFIEEQIEKDDYVVVLGPDSKEYWKRRDTEHLHGPFGDKYEAAEDCYQKQLQRVLP